MGKSIPNVKFELHKVYKTYADQLFQVGDVADIMLENANIPAADSQVETSLRILLSSLLPDSVGISHRHIVDKIGNISYQQDILIAESFFTKSFVEILDGSDFFLYESISATGEVKGAVY